MTEITTAPPTVPIHAPDETRDEGERSCELRIVAAPLLGFAIYEHAELVAALTTRQEVAHWIATRLSELPGEPRENIAPPGYFNGPRIVEQQRAAAAASSRRWPGWRS